MKSLELLLKEFDKVLRKYNPVNYERLYPPLAESELETSLNSLKIKSREFETFFKWKNGFDPKKEIDTDCQIFKFGTMLSLEAIGRKVNINNTKKFIWIDRFIPIISDSTGQYILFNNEMGETFGQLYLYSASIIVAVNLISCYDSIPAMIDTFLFILHSFLPHYL